MPVATRYPMIRTNARSPRSDNLHGIHCSLSRRPCGGATIVTLAQLRPWVDGVAVKPAETLKKRRLKVLLP